MHWLGELPYETAAPVPALKASNWSTAKKTVLPSSRFSMTPLMAMVLRGHRLRACTSLEKITNWICQGSHLSMLRSCSVSLIYVSICSVQAPTGKSWVATFWLSCSFQNVSKVAQCIACNTLSIEKTFKSDQSDNGPGFLFPFKLQMQSQTWLHWISPFFKKFSTFFYL